MTNEDREEINKLIYEHSQGSPTAFNEFCSKFYDAYYRYILSRIKNEYEAKDATQKLFIKLFKIDYKKRTFDNLASYFYDAADGIIIDHMNSLNKYKSKEEELIENIEHNDIHSEIQLDELTVDLTKGELAVLKLRYIHGYTIEETSIKLGVSDRTISKRTKKIKAKVLKRANQWLMVVFVLFSLFQILHLMYPYIY